MKIAVYGATGNVGSRIVSEALARGHQVSALSRHEPSTGLPSGVSWAHGDATDSAAVTAVAAGHDAVVAAFGPSRVPGENPDDYVAELATFVAAVGATPVLVVGGAGSLQAAPGVRLVDTAEFPEVYKTEALAAAAGLDLLRGLDSDTEWTYLSPAPVIGAGERTGRYRTSDETPAGDWISYEDFAVAVLDELERPAHRHARFTVATR